MSTPSHVRVISLIMAISVMLGTGLMVEYTGRRPIPTTALPEQTTSEFPGSAALVMNIPLRTNRW